MLLQTNSYIVPKEKRAEHARLLTRFRQTLARLGCDHFEAYEQVGANWSGSETTGRFVQIMRFRDRKHQQQVQAAERSDSSAQALIQEFCELINFPYQQQQGLFAVGFYTSVLAVAPARGPAAAAEQAQHAQGGANGADAGSAGPDAHPGQNHLHGLAEGSEAEASPAHDPLADEPELSEGESDDRSAGPAPADPSIHHA